ncbi:MAG: ABC transporter permease [Acidobacteriaceae bacterium]
MFVRNRQALFFTLFMPIIIMGVFGLIGFDKPQKINVGIAVNAPPTQGTKNFIDQLNQVSAFNISTGTESQERTAIDKGDRSAVFLVPWDLIPENPATLGQSPSKITVLTNAGQQQQASTAVTVMSQILDKATLSISKAPNLFTLNTEAVNSRNLTYFDFLLPGVVALAIMQMSVFSVAFVFADYKEKGVLKRLLATPMKPYQFVTANIITRLMVAVVQAGILIAVGVLLFHAHVFGSYWLVLLCALLGGIMFLGLGFTISGLANTVESVPAIANLVVFPMLFLGGTFFPLTSMPDWLQHIVKYMPLTYLSHSIRTVMTEGAGISVIRSDLLWMLAWAAVLLILAVFTFRFEERRV